MAYLPEEADPITGVPYRTASSQRITSYLQTLDSTEAYGYGMGHGYTKGWHAGFDHGNKHGHERGVWHGIFMGLLFGVVLPLIGFYFTFHWK